MIRKNRGLFVTVLLLFAVFAIAPAFAAVELPDKLKDMPLYPNSKVQQSMDMGDGVMATAMVKGAKLDAVADFFKTKIKEKGWKVTFQAQEEEAQMLQFQKDGQMFHIHVQAEEDGVTYNMVLQSK